MSDFKFGLTGPRIEFPDAAEIVWAFIRAALKEKEVII